MLVSAQRRGQPQAGGWDQGTAVGQVGPGGGGSEFGVEARKGRKRLKVLVVHILSPLLVCWLLLRLAVTWIGWGETGWETESRVLKPENKSSKLLSPAVLREGTEC